MQPVHDRIVLILAVPAGGWSLLSATSIPNHDCKFRQLLLRVTAAFTRLPTQVDAVNSPPTVANVQAGQGPSAVAATASGRFTNLARANGTASITGLMPATNYTVSMCIAYFAWLC